MNLSQDEINALLGGEDTGTDSPASDGGGLSQAEIDAMLGGSGTEPDSPPASDGGGLSQAEIDAMLGGGAQEQNPNSIDGCSLSSEEIDILGEVGNMCMGAVATTMYTLLGRPVSITTPRVSLHRTRDVLSVYRIPFVVVQVEYTEGIQGKNLLVLKEDDAALITDLLMGGDGVVEQPVELTELHMSAISEIMNQMMGASATSMSRLLDTAINISPPIAKGIDANNDVSDMLSHSSVVIKVSFDMEIEGLLKSELLQLMPYQLGVSLAARLSQTGMGAQESEKTIPESFLTPTPGHTDTLPVSAAEPAPAPAPALTQPAAPYPQQPPYEQPQQQPSYAQPAAPYPAEAFAGMPQFASPQPAAPLPGSLVDVHPVQYPSFDTPAAAGHDMQKGIDMIYDIPLNVTVELGKAQREISDILKFGVGTLVVLDKTAGDPVEIIVNGKLIARGEVVVIDDSYGVRITDIING